MIYNIYVRRPDEISLYVGIFHLEIIAIKYKYLKNALLKKIAKYQDNNDCYLPKYAIEIKNLVL